MPRPDAIDWDTRFAPDYDFDMEILATLPCIPAYAAHRDIVMDFDLKDQVKLTEALQRLGLTYRIRTWNPGIKSRGSALQPGSWRKAQEAAEAYWDKVHPTETAAAVAGD